MSIRFSEEEYADFQRRRKENDFHKPKQSKYKNKKIDCDGIKFDSKKEMARYCELKLLEESGKINNLKLQPVYVLLDSFTSNQGENIRAIKYVGDFEYIDENGKVIVEDTKGFRTKDFLLKAKMFQYRYTDKILKLL